MPPPVPERVAARQAGDQFYWVKKPCRNGHRAKRYTSNGLCSQCSIKNVTKWQAKAPWHPARIAAKAAGHLYYSTGNDCPSGHDQRFVSNGSCGTCSVRRSKKWKDSHPEYDHAGMARKRRAKDPTGHRAAALRWAANNPEQRDAAMKRWRAANREYVRECATINGRNRRTMKTNNGGKHTRDDVLALYVKQIGRCNVCDRNPKRLEVDHIISVIKGGSGDPSNLQLLCQSCNRSKGAHNFEDWLADRHSRRTVLDILFDESATLRSRSPL